MFRSIDFGFCPLPLPQFLAVQLKTLSFKTSEHIIPTTFLRAPPRIFRPCDGPGIHLIIIVYVALKLVNEIIKRLSIVSMSIWRETPQ